MKRILFFIGIFVIILAGYIAAHVGVYFFLVNFFHISVVRTNTLLKETLVFFGASFFFATMLSHFRDTVFTRVYYFLAASWLGILTNLIMFFGLAWLAVISFPKLSTPDNKFVVGILAVFYALAYSVYGAWNAFTPRVKKIKIGINNLPKIWHGKKVVLISDVHLGNIFTERYAHDLASKINSMYPDMILISGDLFDGTDERLDTFIAPLKKLRAPMGIYYATGNHETYIEDDVKAIIAKTHITQLEDALVNVDGLQIIGIDYPTRARKKDVVKVLKNLKDFDVDKPSILLWHTPTQIEEIRQAGVSLLLSGHTHKGQLFPFGFITRMVYGKFDYGFRRIDEQFAVYTSCGLGGWGPPMRTEKTSEIVEIILS